MEDVAGGIAGGELVLYRIVNLKSHDEWNSGVSSLSAEWLFRDTP